MVENFLGGLALVFTIENFFVAIIGVTLGMIMGSIPGLTDTIGIALLIPFTYYMNPQSALVMLMAMTKGGKFGGSIPAILFNMPGTPEAVVTSFDGYPLAKKGQGKKAIQAALFGSTCGDLFSDIVLLLVAAPLAALALKVGPPEYSMIILFSLTIIGTVAGAIPAKGLIAAAFGLLIGVIGRDPMLFTERFTFGILDLESGLNLIPVLIGLLVLSEIFIQIEGYYNDQGIAKKMKKIDYRKEARLSIGEIKGSLVDLFRSSILGTIIGAIPGIGATIGAFISYNEAKRSSKTPEKFGKGSINGIIAAEAGNNAVNGANLIPLVTLGIPGNIAAALVLGAFMIHDMTPGPFLMRQQGHLLYALFITLILSNVVLLGIGSLYSNIAPKVREIPTNILLPIIFLLCSIGSYSVQYSLFDVKAMFVFGIIGYVMRKFDFPAAPVVIAFFLGPLFERRFRESLLMRGGTPAIFLERPVALIFLGLAILSILFTFYRGRHSKKNVMEMVD